MIFIMLLPVAATASSPERACRGS